MLCLGGGLRGLVEMVVFGWDSGRRLGEEL